MIDAHGLFLLATAVASILVLIVLIAHYKINPFIVLFLVSLALAITVGMPLNSVVKSFETGVGNTLGHIAIVIALGTMLGKMMAESGGAERIALTLIRVFGEDRVPWAMMAIGLIVGLPVFFEVGFVLLIPIAFNVAKRTGKSMILVGLPMVAGLSVVHGLVPPHPAALLAVQAFNADIGRTILFALVVGIPAAIVSGPLYAKFIAPRIKLDEFNPIAAQFVEEKSERDLPGFGITIATVLFPVLLMLIGSWADVFTPAGSVANKALRFLGDADISLLAGVLLSFVVLGKMRGFTRDTILTFSTECLAPTASITLLIGAGGGFGRILQDSGVSSAIVQAALNSHVSVIFLAWLVAVIVRLATGSATVAMTTSAQIVAPIAASLPGVHPEYLALAAGAGSLIFSHLNDGGFWLVKEYFHMSVADTMKTWSACETIISVMALLLIVGLAHLF
ncbi:MAG TPA: gluconate:H+ symporter [Candidatus Acidoferrum sp.]|jgi:GntP family gluconate:H+ symporter|nr:gluconate:H+ symporter [Candidatus Acidoferrum sp.]